MEINALVAGIRKLMTDGVPTSEIAILVRINAQLPPIEEALTRAGIEFTVRGQRFYQRAEVRDARRLIRGAELTETGPALITALRTLFKERLGLRGWRRDDRRREPASETRRSSCC